MHDCIYLFFAHICWCGNRFWYGIFCFMAKPLIGIIILGAVLLFSSCAKKITPVYVNNRDSLMVRKRIIKQLDTVYIYVPEQTSERLTRDSSSHLETDFATSDARIMPNGSLQHNLKNKTQKKPVQTEKEIIYNDTTIYKERTVGVPVQVEKKLSWWEQIKQLLGGYAIIGIIAYFVGRRYVSKM